MTRDHRRRGAFTLIELMTTIGVVSLLIALLLPAVQSAREAARGMSCGHNLRQIGIAISAYHAAHECFPINHTSRYGKTNYEGFFSVHVHLLPFLEMASMYHAINFDVGTVPADTYAWPPLTEDERLMIAVNSTVINARVDTFLCPSDRAGVGAAGNNFRGNVGVGGEPRTTAEFEDSGNGFFQEIGMSRAAGVSDGLSHTVAFSERPRGSGAPRAVPERDMWPKAEFTRNADHLMLNCLVSARGSEAYVFMKSGKWWFWSGRERTYYNHAQTPNGRIPDCIAGQRRTATGMVTARSYHPGGVNILLGDGSVRFASRHIDQSAWRALGTRNGGEPVE